MITEQMMREAQMSHINTLKQFVRGMVGAANTKEFKKWLKPHVSKFDPRALKLLIVTAKGNIDLRLKQNWKTLAQAVWLYLRDNQAAKDIKAAKKLTKPLLIEELTKAGFMPRFLKGSTVADLRALLNDAYRRTTKIA